LSSGAEAPEEKIMKEYVEKAMTFAQYEKLIDDLLADGKTTGPNQSAEMYDYARLNRQRMKRLEKTIEVGAEIRDAIAGLDADCYWLVITEGWCGDAAQNIPVIEKIAGLNPGIRTRYILRDENPELMDRFLTNGARSIPYLIAIDARSFEVVGTWSSRPAAGQAYFLELRSQGMAKPEINEKMQRWYNEDGGRSLEMEFVELTKAWLQKKAARKAASS
jgi:hypothetical protein